jgi:hypothetical protein
MIGAIATRTGSLYAGLAFAGTPLFPLGDTRLALGKQSTNTGDGLIDAGSSSRK